MADRYCIVIPHYCHDAQLANFLPALGAAKLPALVIDDGSDAATRVRLHELIASYPWVELIEQKTNKGKGRATIAGMQAAFAQGFSHVITIDADGQHDPADVVRLHQASLAAPHSLYSGKPVFGTDIPLSRLYGRKITNTLARIAADSNVIEDAMCGLRLYPIALVIPLCAQIGWRGRMETDTELLVRACWAGLDLRYINTAVVYPKSGISHFRMIADNARLTLMHAILLLGGLRHRLRRISKPVQQHE